MKKNSQPPTPPLADERNVARLGIVSVQSRLAEDVSKAWNVKFEVANRSFGVNATATNGRPRGIDTNVVLGIEQLFAAQLCPEDNRLHTTPYELRSASFLPLNGKSFHRLRESLDRLWGTSITVTDGWHLPDGRKLRSIKQMRLINELSYWDIESAALAGSARDLVPNATLTIQLGAQMADSIRNGFTQSLETRILRKIEQPPARALYRLLEAHRYKDTGEQMRTLSVDLESWRLACGISEGKPSNTLRALKEAHEELIAVHYLSDVTTNGSRSGTSLHYAFFNPDDPDPALLRLLISNGVGSQVANQLAKTHESRVEEAVRFVTHQKAMGAKVRSSAAMIVDVLKNPEKYVFPESLAIVSSAPSEDTTRQRLAAAERAAQTQAEAEREELLNLSPPLQWERARRSLKLQIGKQLSTPLWDALERACQRGDIHAAQLVKDLSIAQARVELQQFMDDLRRQLS